MTSNPVINVSPVAFAILKALAEYRYLTTNQIRALGISRDRGYLGGQLASLLSASRREETKERKPKEIGELDFGVRPDKGRLPRMYYLTKLGAELLEHLEPDLAPVSYPPRVVRFANDYQHRVGCVDFHIALNTWAQSANQNVDHFRRYFDWSPASTTRSPHPVTRLELTGHRLDADAVFQLSDHQHIQRAFVFEMVNGIDTGRVLKKMEQLAAAIADGSINTALSFPPEKAVRILFVFEYQRTVELVASRASDFPLLQEYAPHFFLKNSTDLEPEALTENWLSPQSEPSLTTLF